MKLLVIILGLLVLQTSGTEAVIIMSVTPESRNVSEGKMVEFTCATLDSGVTLSWNTAPSVGNTFTKDTPLTGGGIQSVLGFTATAQHNKTLITCNAIKGSSGKQSTALLLVQGLLSPVGDLNSTEVDHCTLHFTWTAPFTLQGPPINYYNITITGHSDGAVLGSYTTNTTEILYIVSRLGETLEVVVAAVNDVGTGNSSVTTVLSPSSVSNGLLTFGLDYRDVVRIGDNWTYNFSIKGDICSQAIKEINVEACYDNNSCSSVSGRVDLVLRRVVSTFTNITEDRKYSASVYVQYNGGVVQHSQAVEISTFDLHNITVSSVQNGEVCFTVCYVGGHTTNQSFVKLTCPITQRCFFQIIEEHGCFDNLPPCSYTLSATDVDAVNSIDTMPAVSLEGIIVPGLVIISTHCMSDVVTIMPFTGGLPQESAMTNTSVNSSTATCSPVGVVMLVISGVVLMVTITLNMIISLLCVRCQHRTAPQTKSTTAEYENVQLPEVVEMEKCLAYGVMKKQ